jgi:hypothetical protein
MFFYKAVLACFLVVFSANFVHGTLASDFPTAQKVFKDGSDPMLITLTYLSYLEFDKQDDFKMYKLMYGLDADKKKKLTEYLESEKESYATQGWNLDFLDVGKGFFSNQDSPGVVIASKCDQKTCEVKIAFRGTRSLDDWGNNLNFLKTPLRFVDTHIDKSEYEGFYKAGQVHQGFLKAYNTVSQTISDKLDALRRRNFGARFLIRIGGHSLGGSLATLCAAHIAMKFKKDQHHMIHLETYGSPRTLGEKLSAELTTVLGPENIMRFVNKDEKKAQDMVTLIPLEAILTAQFRHVGEACLLTPKGSEIYEGFPKIKVLRTPHRIEGYKVAYQNQRQCILEEKAPEKKTEFLKKLMLPRNKGASIQSSSQ